MRKVKVIADSCADLNVDQLSKYGIAFAKMSTSCDGVESVATLTWTEDEVHALYNKMRDGNATKGRKAFVCGKSPFQFRSDYYVVHAS